MLKLWITLIFFLIQINAMKLDSILDSNKSLFQCTFQFIFLILISEDFNGYKRVVFVEAHFC